MSSAIRIGILGAARINHAAIIAPARQVPEVLVSAIAARDPARAQAAARKGQIPKIHTTYEALLDDPQIDAVYIPLPNSLHAEWTIRALQAGKHVLCEKPIASNADQAREVADLAARTGRIVAEGMHSRYHALVDRVRQLLEEGSIGELRHVEAHACIINPNRHDIRWQYELGGGALMDMGVYAVAILRALAGREPSEATHVDIKLRKPEVDRWVDAQLAFPGGVTGRVLTSLWGWPILAGLAWAEGTKGTLKVINANVPHLFNRIELIQGKKVIKESVPRLPSTYVSQLRAFADAVRTGIPPRTGPAHFIPNMQVIDMIYRKAGLHPRGQTLPHD
jgi:predicted dehydrogenase